MRHLCMGEHEEQERRPRGREETEVAWERRKAEMAARRARIMADPVLGFYQRYGRPGQDVGFPVPPSQPQRKNPARPN